MTEQEKQELKDFILAREKENKVVYWTCEGLMECDLDELIDSQPIEGMLYDLNRDRMTILTLLDDKWINDYACMLVIKRLKERVDNFETEKQKLLTELWEKINIQTMKYESFPFYHELKQLLISAGMSE